MMTVTPALARPLLVHNLTDTVLRQWHLFKRELYTVTCFVDCSLIYVQHQLRRKGVGYTQYTPTLGTSTWHGALNACKVTTYCVMYLIRVVYVLSPGLLRGHVHTYTISYVRSIRYVFKFIPCDVTCNGCTPVHTAHLSQ